MSPWVGLLALVWAAGLPACGPGRDRAPELVGEFPLAPLRAELERASGQVRVAREQLGSVSPAASAELEAAERSLRRIGGYYLPLLEAESRALAAERFQVTGNRAAVRAELDVIEQLLLGVAREGGARLAREAQDPLEVVTEARTVLESDSTDAVRALQDLVVRIDEMVTRGDLVLRGTELGSER